MSDRPQYPWFTVAINPDRTVIMITEDGDPRGMPRMDMSQATFFKVQAHDASMACELARIKFDEEPSE